MQMEQTDLIFLGLYSALLGYLIGMVHGSWIDKRTINKMPSTFLGEVIFPGPRMITKKYVCTKISPNKYLGNECWQDNMIFLYDNDGLVNVGDTVKIERDLFNFHKKSRMWVNGKRVTFSETKIFQ